MVAKRVLRCLKGTKSNGITYRAEGIIDLHEYVDSDFAGDHANRNYTTGCLLKFSSGVVFWRSKKQTIFALSTSEVEYVALSTAAREVIYLKHVAGNIGLLASWVIRINGDNQTALEMAQEARLTKASNHISIYYHFIREKVEHGHCSSQYVPSEDNVADIMEKGISGPAHIKLPSLMGMELNNQGIGADEICCDILRYTGMFSFIS